MTPGQSPSAARRAGAPAENAEVAPHGVGFLLGVAHRARRRAWEADLADLELTAPQAALLRLIAAQPGSGVRRLARDLGTDPMNVQRIAETLRAAGFCEPRQDPSDARRRPLYPTHEGRRLASAVAHRAQRAEQDLIDALDVERYHALLAGLDALVDHDRRTLDPTNRFPKEAKSDETP
ncbi:MAG: MarR family winged helix-turn-helix transcriptional regulator [Actinomycetota bacterium]|nr:MarR family winged helix-turn-helix transcriptional regulator [Actinomycetota bacterium]MDA8075946.1 MarR family winged helix-turn-helix transcriptional regulator [Actinomycetota bacterium]